MGQGILPPRLRMAQKRLPPATPYFSSLNFPVGIERALKRCCEIRLCLRRKDREIPALVLQRSGDGDIRAQHKFTLDAKVVQPSASDEFPVILRVPVGQLKLASRRKPVRAPGLASSTLAPDPTSQQTAIVGISPAVARVEIKKTCGLLAWDIGVNPFEPQIQFG